MRSMTRADENRAEIVESLKTRLRKMHSHVKYVHGMKRIFDDKRNSVLSVILEKRTNIHDHQREEAIKERIQRVKELNQKVAEKV